MFCVTKRNNWHSLEETRFDGNQTVNFDPSMYHYYVFKKILSHLNKIASPRIGLLSFPVRSSYKAQANLQFASIAEYNNFALLSIEATVLTASNKPKTWNALRPNKHIDPKIQLVTYFKVKC